ncbi:MAG: phosphate propanoyltransferase, partial [Candidatus Latescibacteria bacterium]|nr:phosphate propanoyltransferase [Candidatus Latescibacterota bacterium]
MAALQGQGLVQSDQPAQVPIGVSARHVHLTQHTLEGLFGAGAQLTEYRSLKQPGFFAAEQTVTVVGPRMRAIERVRVLGPLRDYDQVEMSRTDAIAVGLDLLVRDSGDLDGTPGATLVGPAGSVQLSSGVIRAVRHIHLSPEVASAWGVSHRQLIKVSVGGEKPTVLGGVRCRVAEGILLEMHLDTDDANAADVVCGDLMSV